MVRASDDQLVLESHAGGTSTSTEGARPGSSGFRPAETVRTTRGEAGPAAFGNLIEASGHPAFALVLPTYNNLTTLPAVLSQARAAFPLYPIIVVDDGSTDGAGTYLRERQSEQNGDRGEEGESPSRRPQVHVLHHTVNRGKGAALLTGFECAARLGVTHVITVDTDGQHLMEGVTEVAAAACMHPKAIVLGNRRFEASPHVTFASRFGRLFSNFWVWVESGTQVEDTQSGLRCYPLERVPLRSLRATRFDFEIEILVRSLWAGVPVVSTPVPVHYPHPNERVSHFHAWKDNARLTLLHTCLVLERIWSATGRLFKSPTTAVATRERSGSGLLEFWIRIFGIRLCYVIMWLVVPFYFVTGGKEIRALRGFYRHLGSGDRNRPRFLAEMWLVFRNFLFFAASLLDRVALSAGLHTADFRCDLPASLLHAGEPGQVGVPKGFVLVGAHLGDWTLCAQAFAQARPVRLALVMDTTRSRSFMRLLKRISDRNACSEGHFSLKIIDAADRSIALMLEIREHIESGGSVCFLGDRWGDGARLATVDFLGVPARFPLLPFQVARVLDCPLYSFFCVKRALGAQAPHHLAIRDLPFEGRSALEVQESFVRELELRVRETPWCWFNFFDFWGARGSGS